VCNGEAAPAFEGTKWRYFDPDVDNEGACYDCGAGYKGVHGV